MLGRITLPGGPAVLPAGYVERLADELAMERRAREAAERDLAVARRELELSRERLAEHQERERERVAELRAALAVAEQALLEARRPWLVRVLDGWRRR